MSSSEEKTGCPEDEAPLEPDPVIEAYKKDIDRTLLRRNLRLTVTERFEQLMEMQRFVEALRNARTVQEGRLHCST